MEEIIIGILVLRDTLSQAEQDASAAWIVLDRIAILTGWFGRFTVVVATLGKDAGAINDSPSY